MGAPDLVRLTVLALIWSGSFVLLRVLSPALGPLWVATARLLLGGAALAGWLAWRGEAAGLRRHWRTYLFVGIVNCALPFALYAYAALHLPASYMVVLNAATPLIAAALASVVLHERLPAARLAGLLAGIIGVALVTRAVPVPADATFVAASVAALAAAGCYAVAGVWLRHRAARVSPQALGAWSQLFAGVALLPLAMPSHVPGPIDASIVANLLVLALVCSGVAYLLYYRLIRDVGPTRALTVTFLMPVFGIAWGALLLGEPITAGMLGGVALVIAGTAAVVRPSPTATVRSTRAAA
jgi:drug/metabolite transporter (DMT)-like permease